MTKISSIKNVKKGLLILHFPNVKLLCQWGHSETKQFVSWWTGNRDREIEERVQHKT